MAAVEANIETYYNPLVNGLVDDVDATIEQFRAALESAGIQDVLDELELSLIHIWHIGTIGTMQCFILRKKRCIRFNISYIRR